MSKIREILLNEYIGAVAIGFLLAQAIGGFIAAIVQPAVLFWERLTPVEGLFGRTTYTFSWSSVIFPLISVVLHLLAAYLLLYWLYLRQPAKALVGEAAEHAGDQFE